MSCADPCIPEEIFGIFGVDGIVLGIGFPRYLDWGNVGKMLGSDTIG
jgi:hypothetical protein